jgi:sulfur carrier protein ThiS
VDFNTAEHMKRSASTEEKEVVSFKDIMGITQEVPAEEIRGVTQNVIDDMAKQTAEKIIKLNGGKSANAVFVVGGGGKMPGYTDKVADYLGIAHERVAVRGEEVLTCVNFEAEGFKKDSLYVTPVGICTNYYAQKNNFVFVNVNNERIKLYDNNKLTVVDAIMQIGFPNEKLFPRRGQELTFTVNGKTRLVRGTAGEGAVVKLNSRITNLNASIEQNDVIEVVESSVGEAAHLTIGQLEEFSSTISFIVNGKNVLCPKFAYVNGELKSEFYDIQSGDDIHMENYYTISQLFEFLDFDITGLIVHVNNELADKQTKVYENFSVKTQETVVSNDMASFTDLQEDVTKNEETVEDAIEEIDAESDEENQKMTSDKTDNEPLPRKTTTASSEEHIEKTAASIIILVNKEPVKLTGKQAYVLVDLFDFYAFDLSKPRGSIVLTLNGQKCGYTAPLKDGDVVELYWA